ncbi:glycosyltransferase family 1 protein [Paraburkholderia domus]|jgi:hypothetical protein|uniref:Glycosyltransferase n=1 Tax=Paraburkholderia domus TaxID=2793075 RepID=A0A9N8QSM8_9BURK|nr:glycosyltransferase family 1 protein [Paraburkholderia domus]MBK5049070.1 glycosyltransferase family 1 protein [Burkholderia sp. R-70006]MBK5118300.1 glycosyltransferase family 1 protein [Burkholderia sp. R-69980]MBK5164139.1 glycosyltransferase family 1 protein [Burkholderia sp. R-70211]MBK5179825.1 glycosyltransferase family 1 protein [Burkholderia sp. R-69749]MCI0144387.1 glycosyltransferase family 1 protein [Paraburkholderia sediminicola]
MKIFFLHPGKANYPELAAYESYFGRQGFTVYSGTMAEFDKSALGDDCILWCVMGFYPRLPKAKFVVHDYRSLSTGRLGGLKDYLKKIVNPTPSLRIFQNERMRAEMNFNDGVPVAMLPMGVPDWIFSEGESSPDAPVHTFCYIGEMSKERRFDRVLSSYVDYARNRDCSFILVGKPEDEIYRRFNGSRGLHFAGRKPQKETLAIVSAAEFAVCYFPVHRPHCFQTPTKLLEYAALGKRILCNDSVSNISTANDLAIGTVIAGRYVFDALGDAWQTQAPYNEPDRLRGLTWDSVLNDSGVAGYLQAVSDAPA